MSSELPADLCAPWRVVEDIIQGTLSDGSSIRIADIRGWGSLTGSPLGLEDADAEAVQDKWALLIAAAPELLEELQRLVKMVEQDDFELAYDLGIKMDDTRLDPARKLLERLLGELG